MTTLLPAQRTYRVVREGTASHSQHRIEVDTTPGTTQSYILTVLQAKDAAAPGLMPSVVDTGSVFVVTLDGSSSIRFDKGITSSGGSITLGGTMTRFRTTVQTMRVTDAGPVWQ
jgi:hypothetical protein